jgi:uncharacterized protein (DUF2062 family)
VSVPGSINGWIRRRLVEPVLGFLRQGVTPDKLALSLAFGIGIGIFPVLGVSTIACTAVALALRLNLPAIQLFNYLAGPLQLVLIIPFVRVGEHVVGSPPQPLTISAGFEILAQGVVHAIVVLWDAIVHAAIGWIVLGPLLIYAMYRLARPLLERAARKIVAARASAQGAT